MTGYKQGCNADGEALRDFYVEHEPVDLYCDPDEGMTRQEFADECDINVLMATYERTGALNHFNRVEPQYLDVSDVPDLPRSIAIIEAANAAFMTLPASTRREFDNDPVKFVEFAQNPDNLEKMREWNLAPPLPPDPEPIRVVVDAPAAGPAGTPAGGASGAS